jgi:hypothetical protein
VDRKDKVESVSIAQRLLHYPRYKLVLLLLFAACVITAVHYFSSPVVIHRETGEIIISNKAGAGRASYSIKLDTPLYPQSRYELCFTYNTRRLAEPSFIIAEAVGENEIILNFPRNTWGLGDACFRIITNVEFIEPVLTFIDQSPDSTLLIRGLSFSRSGLMLSGMFERLIDQGGLADVYLENNYIKAKFLLPFLAFVTIWLGIGLVLSLHIKGISRIEAVCLAPLAGIVLLSFTAYILSIPGVYNVYLLIAVMLVIMAYGVRGLLKASALSEPVDRFSFRIRDISASRIFDLMAVLMIAVFFIKYLSVSFSPFYGTWDGLVSWNKWGTDWALKEMRGNYQFTSPQMMPLFYSIYYKMAGYSADDPLTLSMNSAHLFNTFLGLLALPFLYFTSKALKVHPIYPVSLTLLSNKFLALINAGMMDNPLVTYYLAASLLILKARNENEIASLSDRSKSMLAVFLLACGGIFLKQTGFFITAAMILFVMANFRKTFWRKQNLPWVMLILLAPAGFYIHELVLQFNPGLVEDNPYNHSIGGVLGVMSFVTIKAPWYVSLVDKLRCVFFNSSRPLQWAHPELPLIIASSVIAFTVYGAYRLYRSNQFRLMFVLVFFVGGHLIIASVFGVGHKGAVETRYVLFLVPSASILAGWLIQKIIQKSKVAERLNIVHVIAIILTISAFAHLHRHSVSTGAPSDGFDTISFERRLERFFFPQFVTLNDYLVSRDNTNFRFFTESTFIFWPSTIYDSESKSIPTKMQDIYQQGDYYYSMMPNAKCPSDFVEVDYGEGFLLCRKE